MMKLLFLLIFVGQGLYAKPSVQVSGNLIQVTAGDKKYVLFASPGFEALHNYEFTLPYLTERVDVDGLLKKIQAAYKKGNFKSALAFVDKILSEHPDLSKAWVLKGSLEYAMGHKDEAKEAWQKSLELNPKNEQVKKILLEFK